ncbi:MAG: hypothetical protein COV99_03290 [Bacteroidetes bacterium CG12_big_fil_rev_8_21_14_0_65_60_17]|nr:MAG: hypothetical protein COV99_03290 [Bacteroidetes bacterium CG12_big_fil_rev_8_21_14_0_65_60_17]
MNCTNERLSPEHLCSDVHFHASHFVTTRTMHIFRSKRISIGISLMLSWLVLFGGSIAPHVHSLLHHELANASHCRYAEQGPAFEPHHSTLHSSDCVFQHRTPETISASGLEETIPQWKRAERQPRFHCLPAQQSVRAHLCRGPPLA